MKKYAICGFGILAGIMLSFTIPMAFAHNEDLLLVKIKQLEKRISEFDTKLNNQKQISDQRIICGSVITNYIKEEKTVQSNRIETKPALADPRKKAGEGFKVRAEMGSHGYGYQYIIEFDKKFAHTPIVVANADDIWDFAVAYATKPESVIIRTRKWGMPDAVEDAAAFSFIAIGKD